MREPRPKDSHTEIETALDELFHAPVPRVSFVSHLEQDLITRARQESQAPSLRQRLSDLLPSAGRGLAFGLGALLLILALAWGIRNLIPVALPAAQASPTPENLAFFPPAAENQTYTHPEIGFTFQYPGDWSLEEAPHSIFVRKGPFRLTIAFRRPEESHQIQPSGLPEGELIEAGSVSFLDQEVSRTELVLDDRVKRVLYDQAREIQFKDVAFVLLLDAGQNDYTAIDIPEQVQAVADQVLASFSLPGLEPLPDILSTEGLGRLAYVQSGDIWVKPLPDGEPIRLTADGSNSSPLWSPSGKWLAYLHSEGQVSLVRADGIGSHVLDFGPVKEFAWSPTADQLAFTLGWGQPDELWVVNADGTHQVNLVSPQEVGESSGQVEGAGSFLWHPLGGKLIYEQWVGGPNQPQTYQGLWEVNSFTGEDRQPAIDTGFPEDNQGVLAGWMAGGKLLLVWRNYLGSASMIVDGGPLWQLPYAGIGQAEPIIDMLTHKDYFSADPTNTGRLAVISGMRGETWADKVLFLYDDTARIGRSLTGSDQAIAFPAFSPDGMHLAYVAMPDQGTGLEVEALHQALLGRDLWLYELRAGNPEDPGQSRQLTNDPVYRDERPEWSRDGQYLLFPRLDAADNASLCLAPVDGGEPILVLDSLAADFDWFGYTGYIYWDAWYDWWQPPAAAPDEYPPLPQMPDTSATPAAALEPPTVTFSEPLVGYAFDYPQGWYLTTAPGTTEISSSDPHTWETKGMLPPGDTQVRFTNDAALKGASFTDLRAATLEGIELAGESVLSEANWALPGDPPAVRLLVSGSNGAYAVLVTVLNGAPLQVYGYGDLSLFDAILSTLRPTP